MVLGICTHANAHAIHMYMRDLVIARVEAGGVVLGAMLHMGMHELLEVGRAPSTCGYTHVYMGRMCIWAAYVHGPQPSNSQVWVRGPAEG